jgi:hypothetical protein
VILKGLAAFGATVAAWMVYSYLKLKIERSRERSHYEYGMEPPK